MLDLVDGREGCEYDREGDDCLVLGREGCEYDREDEWEDEREPLLMDELRPELL